MLAQAYVVAERWRDAAAELAPSCAPPDEDPASCALLGAVYLKSGQLDLAERTLVRVLRHDASLADAHNTLASVYGAAGKYDAALESFARAQALDPDHVDSHFNEGLTCLAAGKPACAEAAFGEVLRLREHHENAKAKLALAIARQGRGKEARRVVKPFEDRNTLSAFILRDMAEVFLLGGDESKAFKYLQLAKKGGIDVEEVEALIEAGAHRPRSVGVGDLIDQAEAYYRASKYGKARELLARAAGEEPREPQVHYWLGRIAAAERKDDEARAHFQKSLDLDPDFDYSRYELGRLAYRGRATPRPPCCWASTWRTRTPAATPTNAGAEPAPARQLCRGQEAAQLGNPKTTRLRQRLLLPRARPPRAGPRRRGPARAPAGGRLALPLGVLPRGRPPPPGPAGGSCREPRRGRAPRHHRPAAGRLRDRERPRGLTRVVDGEHRAPDNRALRGPGTPPRPGDPGGGHRPLQPPGGGARGGFLVVQDDKGTSLVQPQPTALEKGDRGIRPGGLDPHARQRGAHRRSFWRCTARAEEPQTR